MAWRYPTRQVHASRDGMTSRADVTQRYCCHSQEVLIRFALLERGRFPGLICVTLNRLETVESPLSTSKMKMDFSLQVQRAKNWALDSLLVVSLKGSCEHQNSFSFLNYKNICSHQTYIYQIYSGTLFG